MLFYLLQKYKLFLKLHAQRSNILKKIRAFLLAQYSFLPITLGELYTLWQLIFL